MTKPKGKPTGVFVYARGQKWAYSVELAPDPLTNERQQERKSGFATEDDAWTAALKVKAAVDGGRRVSPSKVTVERFYVEWLEAVRDAIKPSTYTNYLDYLKAYVYPVLGKRRLQDIDVPTLNTFYRHLLTSGRKKADTNSLMYDYWKTRRVAGVDPKPKEIAEHCKVSIYAARHAVLRYRRGRLPVVKSPGLAPKTVKNVHRMFHRALADAVAWDYVERNAAASASLPREKRKGKGQRRKGATWTKEQLLTWLRVAVTDRDAGMWVLAATTGARRSELAGAETVLLDLDAGTLEFGDTRVVVDGKTIDEDGKSEAGRRTVSLDAFTVAYLRRHVAMLAREKRAHGTAYHPAGKLMCHPDGRPIHADTVTRRFNRLVDRAGVPRIRLHDVRHTYITIALDEGAEPKVLSDRVGHANLAYTLQIYTHPSTGRDSGTAT